jgi:hypothetical protein
MMDTDDKCENKMESIPPSTEVAEKADRKYEFESKQFAATEKKWLLVLISNSRCWN